MKLRANRTAIIVSLVLPLLSLLIDHYSFDGRIAYGLGIPFDFLFYHMPYGTPERIDVLTGITHWLFRLDTYLICALVYFAVIKIGIAVIQTRWLEWKNR